MRHTFVVAVALVSLVGFTDAARAQVGRRPPPQPPRPGTRTRTPLPGPERVRILLDGGLNVAPGPIDQSFILRRNVEDMPVSARVEQAPAGFFDAGMRVRVSRTVSIGAVAFFTTSPADGSIEAQVPHPLYFNRPRAIGGDLTNLSRSEAGVHAELVYPVMVARRREVTVFGGPSYIRPTRELPVDVRYSESYPYDTATFSSAATAMASAGALGFNVGLDATWRVSRALRAGGLVRYSRATATLALGSGNDVTVRAGGLQLAGGLRILIQKRPAQPRRPPTRR
jgi:hypothetical protein